MSGLSIQTKSLSRALSAVLMLSMVACTGIGSSLRSPSVSLIGVVPTSVTLDRQVFDLTLRFSNPNSIPIPIVGGEASLSLNGLNVATGSLADAVTLPSGGTTDATFSVTTSFGRGVGLAAELLANGTASARYELSMVADVGITGLGRVRFEDEGRIELGWEAIAVPGRR